MSKKIIVDESGSERKLLRLLRGKQVKGKQYYFLLIEDSPQFTTESFNSIVLYENGR